MATQTRKRSTSKSRRKAEPLQPADEIEVETTEEDADDLDELDDEDLDGDEDDLDDDEDEDEPEPEPEPKKAATKAKARTVKPPNPRPRTDDEDEEYVVLSVSTIAPKRASVEVETEEGTKLYDLRLRGDFDIASQNEQARDQSMYDRLAARRQRTPKQNRRMHLLLDRIVRRILVAPAEVIDKLDDEQRWDVVTAFIFAPAAIAQSRAAKAAAQTESQSTSDS